jgi:large subunit ribosomal protein L25
MTAPAALALAAEPRSQRGRHVHALRRRGRVPGVLYGHNVTPQALDVDARTLQRVWRSAGSSHLVDLSLDGGRARKVLIRELQVDPRTASLVHVDLFAVNLREKLTVDVPVIAIGESPAVTVEKVGVLQQILNTLKVECLPGDIPAQLTVDISELVAVDDGIHISEVELPQGVTLATGVNPEELVLKVAPVRVAVEEEEEAAAAEEEAEEGAAEEGAAASGPEPSAEGE